MVTYVIYTFYLEMAMNTDVIPSHSKYSGPSLILTSGIRPSIFNFIL